MTDMQMLFHMLDTLTPEEREQVQEYLEQQRQPQELDKKPRILGLHEHLDGFWMSDDFNDELPDEFWGFDKE